MTHSSDLKKKDDSINDRTNKCTLWEFVLYFLKLGATGFGGPIALVGYMQKHLVEEKKWISHLDYLHGFALAQLCPGPLSSQLAMYLGWIRFGGLGASLVGIALVLPSFIFVVIAAIAYIHYGYLDWVHHAFYGMGASVIALVTRSSIHLIRLTVHRQLSLILICLFNAGLTCHYGIPLIPVIILCGILFMMLDSPPHWIRSRLSIAIPEILFTGINNMAASNELLIKMAVYFTKAGAFTFGSGLAIIPFLKSGVVGEFQWLTEHQFLDAVAMGLVTPGPAIITVSFVGYLIAGLVGAVIATIAIFFPSYLMVLLIAPHYRLIVQNQAMQAFIKGITCAIAGSILGSVIMMGWEAIVDELTIAIFIVSALFIFFVKKIPDPLIVILSGIVGIIAWS